jgi:hypothetical protein
MTEKRQPSQEKQMRLLHISMILPMGAFFAYVFYVVYLLEIGVQISELDLFTHGILIAIIGFIIGLTLYEILLKVYGGEFKFKRLVFRWTLMTSYFSLIYGTFLLFSVLFPWITTFWQWDFGTLTATAIFLIIVWKSRPLLGRLDQGKW